MGADPSSTIKKKNQKPHKILTHTVYDKKTTQTHQENALLLSKRQKSTTKKELPPLWSRNENNCVYTQTEKI